MPKSRIPSPARSQGAITTPRRHLPRKSRSVCSPALSNASGRLTSVVDQYKKMDSFALSPMPTRRSVLTDNTDIEEPRRKSWWKNLNENSQDFMEVLEDNKAASDSGNVVEEIIDIEVLSQENKHLSLDLPDSSDNESIHSIVLAQRKLFTQKENKRQKNFGQLVGSRETLAKLHKTNTTCHEKTVTAGTKDLFQGAKRTKTVFPALLNISPNKTTADKTKENVAIEPKVQVRNIFGNRPANKRKNIFADFIVSESEDEISEIQPKVFGFQKKDEKHGSRTISKGRDPSPTSSITTDIEMDEWRHLPSSTLVENQLEEMVAHTPVKRARLSRLSDIKESEVGSTNTNIETIQSNKSGSSKTRTSPRLKQSSITNNTSVAKTKQSDKTVTSKSRSSLRTKDTTRTETQEDKTEDQNKHIENKSETSLVETETNKSHKVQLDNQKEVEAVNVEDKANITYGKDHFSDHQDNEDIANETNKANKSGLSKSRTSPRLKDLSVSNNASVNKTKQADKTVLSKSRTSPRIKDSSITNNTSVNKTKQSDKAVSRTSPKTKDTSLNEKQNNKAEDKHESKTESKGLEDQIDSQKVVPNEKDIENKKPHEEESKNLLSVNQDLANDNVNEEQQDQPEVIQELEAEQSKDIDEEEEDQANETQESKGEQSDEENEDHTASLIYDESEKENEEEVNESVENNEADESQEDNTESNENQQEISEQTNISQEVEDNEEHELEAKNNTKEENADESQEVSDDNVEDDEANVSQEVDNNDSQDVENESDEGEVDENEIHNSTKESQEANESQEIEADDDETDEIENESKDDQKMNASSDVDRDDAADNSSEQDEMEVDAEGESNIVHSEEVIEESPNVTHDTTGRNRNKIKSPEVILHDKTNLQDTFTAQGRNTSIRKSKSMYKALNIKPSLAPSRDSLGVSGQDSSAEGSGWDSHRTTRKTLRQTFGKDFTPRKSLRALVMEKSAKRQTEHMETLHSETVKLPQANSTEYPEESNREDNNSIVIESDHEVSRNTRLTTLETYLEKIMQKNQENKIKMQEAVRNSLKAPSSQEVLNLFKRPTKPPLRKQKPAANKTKKQNKYTELFGELPSEVIKDMKYKPPKRFQPPNASWVTKRLYNFLESKLEPQYDYKARVRAEKLVETIYEFAKEVLRHRHAVAPPDAVDVLKHELARLNVVKTHFEFYEFFFEFMPRELRIKVVPDVVNKIPMPRHGVFADILRGNAVQGSVH